MGHDCEVIIQDEDKTANSNMGTWWAAKSKIFINSNQSQSMKESALIHEIIEAISWFQRLNLKHDTIVRLETGLYQVLKDNGLLNV